MARECFLVTGALGCVGAWVVAQLVDEGVRVVAFDRASDAYRLSYLIDDERRAHVALVQHDILDLVFLTELMRDWEVTGLIHLAALQVPVARANPFLAAQVNVAGTVAVLEAARTAGTLTGPVVYASSIAAYGAPDADHPESCVTQAGAGAPATHYGVYKRANEDGARVHWSEFGISSLGLRPHVVYGVGRDQGLTSATTGAMLAAAVGRPAVIPFGGSMQMHYTRDVAAQFVAAARSRFTGAAVYNLGGPPTPIAEVVASIEAAAPEAAGTITVQQASLPFPEAVPAGDLESVIGRVPRTALRIGVAETISRFRTLHRIGRLRE